MKRLLVTLLVALSTVAVAGTYASRQGDEVPAVQTGTCDEATPAAAGDERLAHQGCCQGRKGVCGCRAGKIVCCDGSFAQGCPCNRDEDPASSSPATSS
jgi:hypothetical protein